jgi:hypothetical protein
MEGHDYGTGRIQSFSAVWIKEKSYYRIAVKDLIKIRSAKQAKIDRYFEFEIKRFE